jgi:hypothetical protein
MIFTEPVTEPVTEPLTELFTEPFTEPYSVLCFNNSGNGCPFRMVKLPTLRLAIPLAIPPAILLARSVTSALSIVLQSQLLINQ